VRRWQLCGVVLERARSPVERVFSFAWPQLKKENAGRKKKERKKWGKFPCELRQDERRYGESVGRSF
jgi:hypothetical protein